MTTPEQKSLDYYIEHPEEFPTDAEAAAKLLKQLDAEDLPVQLSTEPKPKEGEKAADDKATQGAKPDEKKPDASAATPAKVDQKPDGVLTKDGQHVIPYAEMERRIAEAHSSKEAEAVARRVVEEHAKELEKQLTAAQARAAELEKSGAKPPITTQAVSLELPAELMETLRTEYPTHARAIEGLQAAVKTVNESMDAKLAEIDRRIATHDKDRSAAVTDDVQSLIAGVADLADWQANKPVLFGIAQDTDDAILSDKKFLAEHLAKTGVDLSKDDKARYEVVVARVKQEVGLPAASPKKDDTKEAQRKADEVVAAAKPEHPRSISDIQGGQPPAGNLEDNLDNVPATELGARLLSMSEEQRARFFARVF